MSLPKQSISIALLGAAATATAFLTAASVAAQPADCQSQGQPTPLTCSLSAPGLPNIPSVDAYLPAPNLPAAIPGFVGMP